MIVSERTYRFSYNAWLFILATSLIFRMPATILLIFFTVYNLCFYKHLLITRKRLVYVGLIATPFLLDILFLWNNEVLFEGLKHAEKRLSLFLLPVFILTQNHRLNTILILRFYAMAMTAILSFCLVRFAVISPELFTKYLHGIHLWEMGYKFAESIYTHAPALNMHVAFVVVINFFFFKEALEKKQKAHLFWRFMFLVSSLIILFYINTRLAIVNAFLGIILVSFYSGNDFPRIFTIKKALIGVSLFGILAFGFVKIFPYSIEKFSTVTFGNLNKIGRLDEIKNPEKTIFNSLVTRLSIWKSGVELAQKHPLLGVGAADGKTELIHYYSETNQKFLRKYEFPVHNQYLDFWIKFGVLGVVGILIYIGLFAYVGLRSRQVLCVFFFILFASSNMVDDFLIRFDGIVFSALWLSIFTKHALDNPSCKLK